MVTTEELASLVFSTSRLMRERTEKATAIDPFSQIRLEALQYVMENTAPTMKALAQYFSVQPPTATALVNSLVALGQLARIADRHDRRIVRLMITAKGRGALVRGNHIKVEHMKLKFAPLNSKERDDLARMLRKIGRYYQKT